MDPITAMVFSIIVAGIFTKNIVADSVFKATGKLPPSYLRQQERMRLAAEAVKSVRSGRKPRPPAEGFRGFFKNAYNDAWETADEVRRHRRDKRAKARREKWAADGGGALPGPVSTNARPEEKPSITAPDIPGGTPEPAKPTEEGPERPAPVANTESPSDVKGGGKEESLYQRYAMRRRNGGQPMNALAIADELGVPLTQGEKLQAEWGARYEREQSDQPPAPLKDVDCPQNTQLTPRQQHDQKVTEIADTVPAPRQADTSSALTPDPTTDKTPINGTENTLTANAETTGLQSALAYTKAMAETSAEGATSVETSIAALQQGEVGGAVTGHLATAQEHLTAAQAAFEAANEELSQHLNVQEAYNATPDAGNKQFVTTE